MAAWSFMFSDWQRFQKSSCQNPHEFLHGRFPYMGIRYIPLNFVVVNLKSKMTTSIYSLDGSLQSFHVCLDWFTPP